LIGPFFTLIIPCVDEIEKIIKIQETCYVHITTILKIELEFKINYYICDTPKEVGEIYGDNEPCNGFASPPNIIYAVYNDNKVYLL